MVRAALKNWWREQTVHPTRLYPSRSMCPCAACYNGTEPGQEVFRDPINPKEVPWKQVKAPTKATANVPEPKEPKEAKAKVADKSWYKQARDLTYKPSRQSMASDMQPLCAAPKTRRDSADTLVPARVSMSNLDFVPVY
ncbi:hypothetical protein GGR52DRAFT_62009 [Hypoxylon sp. FL1284]|nr:hypothetical protein GGR52DRAFT_62009 [Hypoxylon sp. FL1284]